MLLEIDREMASAIPRVSPQNAVATVAETAWRLPAPILTVARLLENCGFEGGGNSSQIHKFVESFWHLVVGGAAASAPEPRRGQHTARQHRYLIQRGGFCRETSAHRRAHLPFVVLTKTGSTLRRPEMTGNGTCEG